ncbi:MAG: septum formation family protein, partial [Carbonactinosporaceae bacterium]
RVLVRPPAADDELRRRRRRIDRAGLTAVGAVAVLAVGVGIGMSVPPAPQTLSYGHGGDVPRFWLRDGDCAVGRAQQGQNYGRGSAVRCDRPHDVEVWLARRAARADDRDTSGPRYPRADGLRRTSRDLCRDDFEGRVGAAPESSRYGVTGLFPSAPAWHAGRRAVYCVLWEDGAKPLPTAVAEHG